MEWEVYNKVLEFFNGNENKTRIWMASVNPQLGGMSPNELILMGQTSSLLEFVNEQLDEEDIELYNETNEALDNMKQGDIIDNILKEYGNYNPPHEEFLMDFDAVAVMTKHSLN